MTTHRYGLTLSVLLGLGVLGSACDVEPPASPEYVDDIGPWLDEPAMPRGEPEPEPSTPDPRPEPETPMIEPIEDGSQVLSCGGDRVSVDVPPADVVLVLDKSNSMVSNVWDHDRDPDTAPVTRWASLVDVVDGVVADYDDELRLGAVLFPTVEVETENGANVCDVAGEPDAVVSDFGGDAVMEALPDRDSLDIFGGTPATAGLTLAIEHLESVRGDRPQAIILVTDGAANCAEGQTGNGLYTRYDDQLEVRAAEAAAAGIPVYVVGIDIVDQELDYPRVNPFEALSAVALAGGAAAPGEVPFYNATDENELIEALGQIASEVGCTVELDIAGPSDLMGVLVNGQPMPRTDVCDGDGWRLIEDHGSSKTVQLCPATCETVRETGEVEGSAACLPEQ